MNTEQAIEIWRQALEEEFGLILELRGEEDLEATRYKLYAARREAEDERLESLALCIPGDVSNEIMLVKRSVELED